MTELIRKDGKTCPSAAARRRRRANAWLADDLGVDKNTVEAMRDKLEAGCEIHTLAELLGKDGKTYPRSIEQPKQAAAADECLACR